MSVFLVLPPAMMRSHAAWLRMVLTALTQVVVRNGLQEQNLVHVLVDEAGVLKRLEVIDDILNRYRAYGLRLILMYQSMGQLRECFPDGQDASVLAATTQVFLGCSDLQTAEFVSASTGDQTLLVRSHGGNQSHSTQRSGNDPAGSYSQSWGRSDNLAPTARRLITAAEVMRLDPRACIVLVPSLQPLMTVLSRYYDLPGRPESRWARAACRLGAVLLFALVAACGVRFTEAVSAPRTRPPQRAVNQGVQRGQPGQGVLEGTEKVRKGGEGRGQADGEPRLR